MFKKILYATLIIASIGLLVFGAVNRTLAKGNDIGTGQAGSGRSNGGEQILSGSGNSETINQGNGGQGKQGGSNGNAHSAGASTIPLLTASGDLDANETAALLYMREEEKLALDVYVALSAWWGLPIFQNISQSEQTHTDAVKALIERYNLADPASNTLGVFTNLDLQGLYDSLIARGSQSVNEALKVGAAIEEIDILDLDKYLSQTDNADIQQVFTNLKYGSYNHLGAFTSTLFRQTGETYQPQYLSLEAYHAIIDSSGDTVGGGNGGNSRAGSADGYRGGRP
jgi:hypothetical protein